ncbi:MAG: pyruvate kinase alpha/beta domain-containing protein [Desulfovibrionaceae bacterium]|nr:pyruvate kinase alpha/beta domain-containing protein [Desulfovibrionaceae bacterium]
MHFDSKGPQNTAEAVRLAKETAAERNIGHIVVASNYGDTAELFADVAAERHIVCVTHAFGYAGRGKCEMTPERRAALQAMGIDVLTTTHVLSGAERALSKSFQGYGPVEIMARTLYMLGQGTKVCVEVAVMALDAGLIPYGEDILAVGGSARGADTVAVVAPSHASSILDTRIRGIVCKPWDF